MNEAIAKAIAARKAAQDNVRQVLMREQAICQHPRIVHLRWRPGEWLGAIRARRLCLECRLEEEAQRFGDDDSEFTHLKSDGFHKIVGDDEFYRHRIAEAAIDGQLKCEKADAA